MRLALLAILCLAAPACRGPATVKVAHLPPTSKDVIEAALASSQAPLSDSTCNGFGTETTDKTIGRYLAGYLAELAAPDGGNSLITSVTPGTEAGQAVYVCRLMVRHAKGEDVWSWGVQFSARQDDGSVLPNSIKCLGAG
ncbi:MAG: hypothetical protein ABJF23_04875 [Bryobacteraceae bacterium]